MKTIEERAKKYIDGMKITDVPSEVLLKAGYINGAIDQCEIDIQRAIVWFKDNTMRNAFIDDNGLQNDDWQNSFIQAMKGE